MSSFVKLQGASSVPMDPLPSWRISEARRPAMLIVVSSTSKYEWASAEEDADIELTIEEVLTSLI